MSKGGNKINGIGLLKEKDIRSERVKILLHLLHNIINLIACI